jgi:hypothetical protein
MRACCCDHHVGNLPGRLAMVPGEPLACGNAASSPRCGTDLKRVPPRTDWVAAMITPPRVVVVMGGVAVLSGGRTVWVLLAWMLHLPPSAVSLVGDVRFRRSA